MYCRLGSVLKGTYIGERGSHERLACSHTRISTFRAVIATAHPKDTVSRALVLSQSFPFRDIMSASPPLQVLGAFNPCSNCIQRPL